ncbi:hypothetical protein KKA14_20665, partial [bacterium]|nr:hypothetical protein [bacterium]
REIESVGISTISVTLNKEITRKLNPPRSVYVGFPLGHPLSFPGQAFRQLNILRVLLEYLETIDTPGTLIELDLKSPDDPDLKCSICV